VFKLTTENNLAIIHGLISLTDKGDHVFMDLTEAQNSTRESGNFTEA